MSPKDNTPARNTWEKEFETCYADSVCQCMENGASTSKRPTLWGGVVVTARKKRARLPRNPSGPAAVFGNARFRLFLDSRLLANCHKREMG